MTTTRTAFIVCLLALLLPAQVSAAEQLRATGTGQSQFEAVKAASKQIMDKAFKIVLERAVTQDEPARQRFERDIEEEFTRTRSRYFSDMDATCREGERVECSVVATVKMLEVEASVANFIDESGANRQRVAFLVDRENVESGAEADAVAFLLDKLGRQMGYDVYPVSRYLTVETLRADCMAFPEAIEQQRRKGAGFADVVREMEANYRACQDLLDREAIIVVDDMDIVVGAYDAKARMVEGTITPRLSFHRIDSERQLPAPRPLAIAKHATGSSRQLATSNLHNALFIDAANYVAQQYNAISLTRQGRKRMDRDRADEPREYTVRVTGISRDDRGGRAQLQHIERLFEDRFADFEADFDHGGRSEHVYRFTADQKFRLLRLTDSLRDEFEEYGMNTNIDVSRARTITIAFATERQLSEPAIAWGDDRIRKAFAVERNTLRTIREDQATGVAMSLLEAELAIRNKKRGPYTFTVEPVWRDANGVVLATEYKQAKTLTLDRKASRNVVFRSPSRSAQAVEFQLTCASKDCK